MILVEYDDYANMNVSTLCFIIDSKPPKGGRLGEG
jgi:hypothetical protein